jgi:hypothetical protein
MEVMSGEQLAELEATSSLPTRPHRLACQKSCLANSWPSSKRHHLCRSDFYRFACQKSCLANSWLSPKRNHRHFTGSEVMSGKRLAGAGASAPDLHISLAILVCRACNKVNRESRRPSSSKEPDVAPSSHHARNHRLSTTSLTLSIYSLVCFRPSTRDRIESSQTT